MVVKSSQGVLKTPLKKFRQRDSDRGGNFAVFNRTLLVNVNRGIFNDLKKRSHYKL
jgi:hypothetical protein